MYISNEDKQNYSFCWLRLVGETFEHSLIKQTKFIKVSKVVKQTNKKTLS